MDCKRFTDMQNPKNSKALIINVFNNVMYVINNNYLCTKRTKLYLQDEG